MEENSHSIPIIILQSSFFLFLFTATRHYTRKSLLPAEAWILIFGVIYGVANRFTEVK